MDEEFGREMSRDRGCSMENLQRTNCLSFIFSHFSYFKLHSLYIVFLTVEIILQVVGVLKEPHYCVTLPPKSLILVEITEIKDNAEETINK